jgi:hypothetical protein
LRAMCRARLALGAGFAINAISTISLDVTMTLACRLEN